MKNLKAILEKYPYSYELIYNETSGSAEKTICGIEIMHMIRKGQVEEIQCALSEVRFFNNIMGIVA